MEQLKFAKLDIPLAELLDVEELAVTNEQSENVETLLKKLEYDASKSTIPFDKLTVNRIEQKDDCVLIDISKLEDVKLLGIRTGIWRDRENPETVYFSYFYYEKPWLIYDSWEEYVEAERNGFVEHEPERFELPVTKIIYYDTEEHVLWEK